MWAHVQDRAGAETRGQPVGVGFVQLLHVRLRHWTQIVQFGGCTFTHWAISLALGCFILKYLAGLLLKKKKWQGTERENIANLNRNKYHSCNTTNTHWVMRERNYSLSDNSQYWGAIGTSECVIKHSVAFYINSPFWACIEKKRAPSLPDIGAMKHLSVGTRRDWHLAILI